MAAVKAKEPVKEEPVGDPNDLGIFVSTCAIGYSEPSGARIRAIEEALRGVGAKDISQSFLKDLLTIKLIAPDESSGIVIYNAPMAAEFITSIRRAMVSAYHQKAHTEMATGQIGGQE